MPNKQKSDLLSDRDGASLINCSRATWWRRVKDGTLPKPIHIGGLARWPRTEINEAIRKLREAR